jgi:hypothetical protein
VLIRSASRRHKLPLRAAYFRQVLPLVRGFPMPRVLRLMRLPMHIRRAFPFTGLLRLPARLSSPTLRFPLNSVSGFPLACLSNDIPSVRPSHRQERLGPPKLFSVSLASHAQAFRLRRTSTPKPFGRLVSPSGTLKPSASANQAYLEAVPAQKASAVSPTAYRILCLRFACLVRPSLDSATDARLDTGGWLALPRQGLSPRKKYRAFLGAITSKLRGARPDE